jgi:hypothetical protein
MKGMGTDEDSIIKLVGNRSNIERQQIITYYKSSFGRDLIEDLKDEISGDFKKVVIAMFMAPAEYDAYELNKAMKGLGTDEDTIIEILGSRSNSRIQEIKNIFKLKYGRDLEKEIVSETSGYLQKLLVALLQCKRSENMYPDQNQVMQEASDLYKAGEAQWGTDESVFVKLCSLRSPHELYAICQAYQNLAQKSIFESIDSEFSGDIKELLKTVIQAMIMPSQYFANRIRKATKGWGTNDEMLIRVLVSRDEVDLPQIKACFLQLYGIDLLSEIKDETSGDYKKMLLELAKR